MNRYYGQRGMGMVTPPEYLVSGEGFARTVNQLAGGFGLPAATGTNLTYLAVGLAAGWWLGRNMTRKNIRRKLKKQLSL